MKPADQIKAALAAYSAEHQEKIEVCAKIRKIYPGDPTLRHLDRGTLRLRTLAALDALGEIGFSDAKDLLQIPCLTNLGRELIGQGFPIRMEKRGHSGTTPLFALILND